MSKKDEALKLAEDALKRVRTQDMELVQLSMIALAAIREALAERPAVSAGPITPAMMQGPTPEQKSQMVAAMSKLAEQPAQQEPVVFYRCNGCGHAYEQVHPTSCDCMEAGGFDRVEYYTSPQAQRTWVGLTDVEIASACKKNGGAEWWWRDIEEYGRAIEAKLKEKNA